MPGGDRTGPGGMGPMTGRGAGYCGGFEVPGYTAPQAYYGFGAGHRHWGGGPWRRGHRFAGGGPYRWAPYGGPFWGAAGRDPASEKAVLESRAGALQAELEMIKKRLEEFESPARED